MNLEDLLEQEENVAVGDDEVDSIREVKEFVEENSSVEFRGSNNLTQSNIRVTKAIPANSKFSVGSFARLAELISNKTGVQVTQRQAAASWYYILYQLFYNK
ncbi:MAG: hypothetical protein ACOCRO_05845 [Halanaerobiales bacterium]